jgi:hypothetical protein
LLKSPALVPGFLLALVFDRLALAAAADPAFYVGSGKQEDER